MEGLSGPLTKTLIQSVRITHTVKQPQEETGFYYPEERSNPIQTIEDFRLNANTGHAEPQSSNNNTPTVQYF